MKWEKLENQSASLPSGREFSSMVCLNRNTLLLFGGGHGSLTSGTKVFYGDTWEYDIPTASWSKIETAINPAHRRLSALVSIGDNKALLFGGHTDVDSKQKFYKDTWIYDGDKHLWQKVCSGGPQGCDGHQMAYVGDGKVVLFGGMSQAETWCFDLNELCWQRLDLQGPLPRARHYHGMCSAGNGELLLFGGDTLADTWMFNLDQQRWTLIETPENSTPPARRYHDMVLLSSGQILLHGGFMGFPNFCDTWTFDMQKLCWSEVMMQRLPTAAHGFTLVACAHDTVFRFGGFTDRDNINELWMLEL